MNSNEMVKQTSEEPQTLSELPVLTPPVDIYENDDEILLVADFPGVGPDQIDVRLDAGQLDISGAQSKPESSSTTAFLPPVQFARSFRVPETIDANGVEAQLTNGVLRVVLKKSEAAKPRRIQVTMG